MPVLCGLQKYPLLLKSILFCSSSTLEVLIGKLDNHLSRKSSPLLQHCD